MAGCPSRDSAATIFLVEISVHGLPPVALRAVLGAHEPWILLGRDVLNRLRVLLDGPAQGLEIG